MNNGCADKGVFAVLAVFNQFSNPFIGLHSSMLVTNAEECFLILNIPICYVCLLSSGGFLYLSYGKAIFSNMTHLSQDTSEKDLGDFEKNWKFDFEDEKE